MLACIHLARPSLNCTGACPSGLGGTAKKMDRTNTKVGAGQRESPAALSQHGSPCNIEKHCKTLKIWGKSRELAQVLVLAASSQQTRSKPGQTPG